MSTEIPLKKSLIISPFYEGIKNFGKSQSNEETYRTPSISEYHYGFECEVLDEDSGEWDKVILSQLDVIKLMEFRCDWKVRVNYLNHEDITRLWFEKGMFVNIWSEDNDVIEGFCRKISDTDMFVLFYDKETKILGIYLQKVYNKITGNWTADVVFLGLINDKNAFQNVLFALGMLHTGEFEL